ncbi:MAG: terminase family protein, partial [Methanotrichaceae archaeon]
MTLSENFLESIDPVTWWNHYSRRKLHDYQIEVLQYGGDVLLNCSRQSGKSTVAAIKAVHRCVFYPRSTVVIISYNLAQAEELCRKAADICDIVRAHVTSQSLSHIEFSNKSRIICVPGTEASARSYSSVSLLIVDESSRVDDEIIFS